MNILLASFILWLLFIPTSNIVNRHREKALTGWRKYLGFTWVYLFVAVDVIFNFTYGAILFLDFTSFERLTLTARLKHYLRTQPDTWRGKLSLFICMYIIEPIDYGHCSIK